MKKFTTLLLCSMSICLIILPALLPERTHAAGATGVCSQASSNSLGYVTGMSYVVDVGAQVVASAGTGSQFMAYLGCDTNESQAITSAGTLSLGSLGNAGAISSTVTISKDAGSISVDEKASLASVSLFNGLITVNALQAEASSKGTAINATSTNNTTFGGAVVHVGFFPIPILLSPPPNFGVDLPGIGKLIANEQTITNTADGTMISVNALDINVLSSNSFGLPLGAHLVVGHAESKFARTLPRQLVCASGYAVNAQANATIATASSGPWISARAPVTGGHAQGSLKSLNVPVIGDAGEIQVIADSQLTPNLDAKVRGSGARISLLGGLVQADAIHGEEHAFIGPDGPDATASASIAQVVIAGQVAAAKPGANTRVQVPGVGSLTINEQNITKDATSSSAELNLLDLNIDGPNKFGLPVGFRIIIGHFYVCLMGATAHVAPPTPVVTPTPQVTPGSTGTPVQVTPTPQVTPKPAETSTPTPVLPTVTPAPVTPTAIVGGKGPDLKMTVTDIGGAISFGKPAILRVDVTNNTIADPVMVGQPITVTFTLPDGFTVKPSQKGDWQLAFDPNTGNIVATYTGAYPIAPGASLSPIYLIGAPLNAAPLQVSAAVATPGDVNPNDNVFDLTIPVLGFGSCPCSN